MAVHGSYDISQFAADTKAEIQRLKAQTDLFWTQEHELYRQVGLKDGMSLLDCGCGPGYVLSKLKASLPSLVCTGIELNPILVEVAQQELRACPDCTLLENSVCALSLPDNTFDFAIVRLVLEHLVEPLQGIQEVLRVLKPGGTAVFIDNDFDLHERTFPDSPSLQKLYAAYRSARRKEGGNPCIGRELPVLLQEAGFEEIDLNLLAAHSHITGDSAFLRAEGVGIPAQLVKNGYLAPEVLEQVALEWSAMLQTPGHTIFRMLFAGIGRKPLESNAASGVMSEYSRSGNGKLAESLGSSFMPGVLHSEAEIQRFIQTTLAEELETAPHALDLEESLIHLGVDSIAAVGLCNRIKSHLLVSLPIAEVLCGDSISGVTRKIMVLLSNTPETQKASNRVIGPQPRG